VKAQASLLGQGLGLVVAVAALGALALSLTSSQQGKFTILWWDATANVEKLSTREGIIDILEKCKRAGIRAVAVGIKPISGEVLYPSRIAPRLTDWQGFSVPPDFDRLQVALEEGRKRKIQIHALLMAFSEGHLTFQRGPIYTTHPEWQSVVYDVKDGNPQLVPITQLGRGVAGFVNPVLPEVQQYELSILEEVLQRYDADAIVFDRVRFNGIDSDFSDYSRQDFERFLGRKVERWPEDIYELRVRGERVDRIPGPYYRQWLFYRAKFIHDFFERLVQTVRRIRPKLPVGDYVGAWYPTYYEYGVNWASPKYLPPYEWALPVYHETGYADLLDYLAVGCYFPRITLAEAKRDTANWWESVEGAARIAEAVVMAACPVYASIYAEDFKSSGERFGQALRLALLLTEGLKIFDLSQIEKYRYWDEIAEALEGGQY